MDEVYQLLVVLILLDEFPHDLRDGADLHQLVFEVHPGHNPGLDRLDVHLATSSFVRGSNGKVFQEKPGMRLTQRSPPVSGTGHCEAILPLCASMSAGPRGIKEPLVSPPLSP
jgi:hypothetical protein